jgi:hypothetical protein
MHCVGIKYYLVTDFLYFYGLGGPDSIPGRRRFYFFLQSADRFWGPHSLLSNDIRGDLPGDKDVGA